jgi:hypothetical protein
VKNWQHAREIPHAVEGSWGKAFEKKAMLTSLTVAGDQEHPSKCRMLQSPAKISVTRFLQISNFTPNSLPCNQTK